MVDRRYCSLNIGMLFPFFPVPHCNPTCRIYDYIIDMQTIIQTIYIHTYIHTSTYIHSYIHTSIHTYLLSSVVSSLEVSKKNPRDPSCLRHYKMTPLILMRRLAIRDPICFPCPRLKQTRPGRKSP